MRCRYLPDLFSIAHHIFFYFFFLHTELCPYIFIGFFLSLFTTFNQKKFEYESSLNIFVWVWVFLSPLFLHFDSHSTLFQLFPIHCRSKWNKIEILLIMDAFADYFSHLSYIHFVIHTKWREISTKYFNDTSQYGRKKDNVSINQIAKMLTAKWDPLNCFNCLTWLLNGKIVLTKTKLKRNWIKKEAKQQKTTQKSQKNNKSCIEWKINGQNVPKNKNKNKL